jgi:hypothetical protein
LLVGAIPILLMNRILIFLSYFLFLLHLFFDLLTHQKYSSEWKLNAFKDKFGLSCISIWL